MDPVIVVGPPRSGTSVIARLLQEKCGVMMDEGPVRKDAANMYGYYEDQRLLEINRNLFGRWDNGKFEKDVDPQWKTEFSGWIYERTKKYGRWGFKDPRMLGIMTWVFEFFDPIFIWPIRQNSQIIQSQVIKLGYPLDIAREYTTFCEKYIVKFLSCKRLFKIDLNQRRSEKKLTKHLHTILKDIS